MHTKNENYSRKYQELFDDARAHFRSSKEKSSLWKAYVNLEYAILDIKLRNKITATNIENSNKVKKKDLASSLREAGRLFDELELDSSTTIIASLEKLREIRDLLKVCLLKL